MRRAVGDPLTFAATARPWSASTATARRSFQAPAPSMHASSVPGLSPRVETCACRRPGARDGTVRVWDVEAGRLRFMLQVCLMRV